MYKRYVAIGDSTSEGLDDPDGAGGYRGWANRFAEMMAAQQDAPLMYANLAVRGLRTPQILEQQLDLALAMEPDIATVVSGTNDVLRQNFDADVYGRDVERMQRALVDQGATVLTFTLPDLTRVNPATRFVRGRVAAMNAALRAVSAKTGAIVVDLAQHAVASDRRMWSPDRLHANSLGHARIAAALAHAIRLEGSDASWTEPMTGSDDAGIVARLGDHATWSRTYLWPWLLRRMQGASSGDGISCKRPTLTPVMK